MGKKTLHPQNFEERVVWYSITLTYVFYLLGALYIVAPVIGWILLAYLFKKLWLQNHTTPNDEIVRIPVGVWIWVICMFVMLIALWIGHIDWNLGTPKTIKSTVGWAKGWALMAIFPLIGCLNIRPQIIYRATNLVCLQTLCIFPFLALAYLLSLPQELYISPLKIVGGPGPEYFRVSLYSITPEGGVRWFLFAPWAPALGFVASIFLLFSLQEYSVKKDRKWFWVGFFGSLLMIFICKSRLALVVAVLLPMALYILSNLTKLFIIFQGAFVTLIGGFTAPSLITYFENFKDGFRAARADSSRVREALGRIAVERWENEAVLWGHGIVERGPHLVQYMPIGSHHSWYGLLFVKGAVGFAALAIGVAFSFIELVLKSQTSQTARVGLGFIIILFLYTFGENLEILSYLFWPGLIILGIAHNEPFISPFEKRESAESETAINNEEHRL